MSELQTYLGWKIDFRNPQGEPSGLPPDSMHWKVYKNPVAMAVGGVAGANWKQFSLTQSPERVQRRRTAHVHKRL